MHLLHASLAEKIRGLIEAGHYGEATDEWEQLEDFIISSSNGVVSDVMFNTLRINWF